MTTEPESRLSKCFEWGLNCKTLEFDEARSRKILDSFGITDRQERDFFWMGFLEEPRKGGALVQINLGPSA